MSKKMTSIEKEMFDKGFVSSRMAAFKLKLHFKSVLMKVTRDQVKAVRIGRQQFIEVDSLKKHYGAEACRMLDLDNWSDVFEEKDGDLFVRELEA